MKKLLLALLAILTFQLSWAQLNTTSQTSIDTSLKKSNKKLSINESEIVDKKNYIYVVKNLNVKDASGQYELIPFIGNKSFLITKKNVYEIDHGDLINKWKIKQMSKGDVDVLLLINTYDGTEFLLEDFFVETLPSGESTSYDVEEQSARKALIKKKYIINSTKKIN
jgi:hypothetical protein